MRDEDASIVCLPNLFVFGSLCLHCPPVNPIKILDQIKALENRKRMKLSRKKNG